MAGLMRAACQAGRLTCSPAKQGCLHRMLDTHQLFSFDPHIHTL